MTGPHAHALDALQAPVARGLLRQRHVPHVIVRFPGMGTVFGPLTAADPACTVDGLLESVRPGPDGPVYTTLAVARGLPEPAAQAALASLARRYEQAPEVLRRQPGPLVFRTAMRGSALPPPLRSLARLQSDAGARWSRVERGEYSVRARVPLGASGALLADRILGDLEDTGLAAEVEVRSVAGRELAELREAEEAARLHAATRVNWLRRRAAA